MDFIQIPNTNCKIYDGSVVMIARFPQTKWIVHNGFYSYSGQQQSGWYFESIPAGTIIPMNSADLTTLTIISNPSGDTPVCPPPGPEPGPIPRPDYPGPCPHHHTGKSIEKYRPGMHYKAGQTLYGAIGEYYQVVEDYRSSYSEQSTAQNIQKDVTNGYLIAVPTTKDIDTINKNVAAVETKADKAATDIETVAQDLAETTSSLDEKIEGLDNSKVDKTVLGDDKVVTKVEISITGDEANGNGTVIVKTTSASLEDGSETENSETVDLTDAGVATEEYVDDKVETKVDTSTKVNGHELTEDVTIGPDDINYTNPKLSEVENVKEALDALVEKEPDLSTKMDKQPTAVSGHIATFDNEGQVVDSGKTVDDIRPVWDDGE